jgi:hypothetical protein
MVRRMTFAITFVLAVGAGSPVIFASGFDFTPAMISAAGKHCVHGFWVNEQSVAFYAGDTDQLNHDLSEHMEGRYATRKLVIHVGAKRAESPWDKTPRDLFADWSVNAFDDPNDADQAVPRMCLQVDVWLSSKIKLEELRIPDKFDVISGGEIEKFIQRRRSQVK